MLAGVLATAGALAALAERRDAPAEARAGRAMAGLGLLGAAAALAAVGAVVLGPGDTGPMQRAVFAGATATVLVPLLAVRLVVGARRASRFRGGG